MSCVHKRQPDFVILFIIYYFFLYFLELNEHNPIITKYIMNILKKRDFNLQIYQQISSNLELVSEKLTLILAYN